MNRQIKRVIVSLTVILCAAAAFGIRLTEHLAGPPRATFNAAEIRSYRDIPNITDEEIAAIEALKADKGRRFSYGMMLTSESFIRADGTQAGFAVHFCGLLSGLFGVPFDLELRTWDVLKPGLDNRSIDFAGDLTATPERREKYCMTSPIAQRTVEAYYNGETPIKIETENDLNGLKIGFLEGTITESAVRYYYPALDFDARVVNGVSEAAEKLKSGEIEAFIVDSPATISMAGYKFIRSANALPLLYTPVSMVTANPALAPVISAVDKYIAAGGNRKLGELYNTGEREFIRHRLDASLSEEETAWLDGLAASGRKIPVVLLGDNYPVCFYNEQEEEYQGIAVDILSEISAFTDIEYEIKSNKDTGWEEMLRMLETGEASLISYLPENLERRENGFLRTRQPYLTSGYALLSKSGYPNLKMYQVTNSTVGIIGGSAAAEKFAAWFPDNENVRLFAGVNEALDALEKNEIDLLMTSEHTLLAQTNYREKLGYKVNILLPASNESSFGFNKNERSLCSIVEKAQPFVSTKDIVRKWTSRIYDYSRNMAEERTFLLSIITAGLCLGLAGMALVFFVFLRKNRLIAKQASLLNALYDSSPDLIVSKDVNGRYTSFNKCFKEFIRLPEAEILGKTTHEVFEGREEELLMFLETDRVIFSGGAVAKGEGWYLFPDGSHRLFELVKIPVKEYGKLTGAMGVSRDITEYRTAVEKAQKASKSKSDFLARMSHELRTPMNAIVGLSELAMKEQNANTIHEYAATVRQASLNLMSLINDILDLSKIERGKMEILPAPYRFSSLVNDVVSIIRMRVLHSPQIHFAVNVDSGLPDALIGDEAKLRQVLINLLGNAAKYTDSGFVALTVTGKAADGASVLLTMEVADSGRGIKAEDIEYIFGEYAQTDRRENKHIEGTGLGLSITRSIVEAMEGKIGVTSEYGKGSVFTVTIPQKIREPGRLATVKNPEEKSVLLYERRGVYANTIELSLKDLGVDYKRVSSEADLFAELAGGKYAFLFVASQLYRQNESSITRAIDANQVPQATQEAQRARKTRAVLLAKFGETVSGGGSRPLSMPKLLSMPAYCIPIAKVLNGESHTPAGKSGPENARFTAPDAKILIVDDSATNLKVAEAMIAPYKIQTETRKNGVEAIDAVRSQRYDLVLMDHKMPEMDGVEAVRRIRAEGDAYLRSVPIVALTGDVSPEMKSAFLNGGFSDYLSKPIDAAKLNGILGKWIPADKQNGS